MATTYYNIKQLLTLEGVVKKDGRKITRDDLGIIENGYLVVSDGEVKEVGTGKYPESETNIDLKECVVMPAFVDSHTHITFSGTRVNEFELRSEGKTYAEIAAAGGGIISTVNSTRRSTADELYKNTLGNIKRMNTFGTGIIEAKSGYGLDAETELKQLEAIATAKKDYPYVVPTFMGAHDTPPGGGDKDLRRKSYIDIIVKTLIPKVVENKLAVFCDVFLDEGYYTREETEFILKEAKKFGLIPKIHADEFTNQEAAILAVELGAASADHLLYVSEKGIEALAASDTVATFLPGTSFNLGLPYAPTKKLIDAGACIAIASDFNPGSSACLNLQFILAIAISRYKISVAQAIAAACYGGAKALMVEKEFGNLCKGASAFFQIYNASCYSDVFYNYGENHLIKLVTPNI
ncbi:MAG: imidazolonepropionase [Pseudomonadota bacterium]